ncbi:MAG TPA: energy transducer TonB [Candidatus Acidoferrales bacterium]|nr:energy transducer TonB [Candidatus Acidoferrales bacterium]
MPLLNEISTLLRRILRISAAAFVIFFCAVIPSYAQQTQIAALTLQTADALEKAHAKKVAVLDFSGPGLEVTQFGRDLANQFSDALAKFDDKFVMSDRPQFLQALSAAKPSMATPSDLNSGQLAKTIHADTEVLGHLKSDGTRVSLAVEVRTVKHGKTVAKFHETFEESKDMDAELAQVLSKVDYPDSDAIGYTEPTCIRCPNPQYSDAAFKAHVEGSVELSAVIETDGRASHIVVEKRLGAGLDENAVNAVQDWEFRPSQGPDGKPAAVRILFTLDFYLH